MVTFLILLLILGPTQSLANLYYGFCYILGLLFILFIVYIAAVHIVNRICVFPFDYENMLASIRRYIKNNKLEEYQENKNLIMYFNNFGYGYCIRVKNKVKSDRMIEITVENDDNYISTIWAIFQMNFNDNVNYIGVKLWIMIMRICDTNFKNLVKIDYLQ